MKTALIAVDGRQLARTTIPITRHVTPDDGVEQDPGEIWQAVLASMQATLKAVPLGTHSPLAIGFSSQRAGMMLLNANADPLTPYLCWMDQRGIVELKDHYSKHADVLDKVAEFRIGPTALARLLWLQKHMPDAWKSARYVSTTIKDYILYRLTGTLVTDSASASVTGMYNMNAGCWHASILDLAQVPKARLLTLATPYTVIGTVRDELVNQLGLPHFTPVVLGGDDGGCSNIGLGVIDATRMAVSIGTVGAVRSTMPVITQPDSHKQGLVWANWQPLGWECAAPIRAAGAAVDWLHGLFAHPTLYAQAESISAGSEGLLALPYIHGRGYPQPKPHMRGALYGLSPVHTAAHLLRAQVEGVAFALRHAAESMHAGAECPHALRFGGGVARSPLWSNVLAGVMGCPLEITQNEDASLIGAAVLAAVAVGLHRRIDTACAAMVRVDRTVQPDEHDVSIYREAYQRFLCLNQLTCAVL